MLKSEFNKVYLRLDALYDAAVVAFTLPNLWQSKIKDRSILGSDTYNQYCENEHCERKTADAVFKPEGGSILEKGASTCYACTDKGTYDFEVQSTISVYRKLLPLLKERMLDRWDVKQGETYKAEFYELVIVTLLLAISSLDRVKPEFTPEQVRTIEAFGEEVVGLCTSLLKEACPKDLLTSSSSEKAYWAFDAPSWNSSILLDRQEYRGVGPLVDANTDVHSRNILAYIANCTRATYKDLWVVEVDSSMPVPGFLLGAAANITRLPTQSELEVAYAFTGDGLEAPDAVATAISL